MAGIIDDARAGKTLTTPLKPLDPGDLGADPGDGTGSTAPQPATPDPTSATPVPKGVPPLAPPPDESNATPVPKGVPPNPTGSQPNPLAPGDGSPNIGAPGPDLGAPASAAPPLKPAVDGNLAAPPTGTAGTTGTGTSSPFSWSPTGGIIDGIKGITPQTVDATGYTSGGVGAAPDATAEGYDATGYTAQQGTAATSDENVSQAVDRIIDENSPLMQREKARALDTANDRGLLNTTMAAQAGESAVLDKASEIGAGDVQNAQFNAQQQNVMTINNVNQANAAAAFHAEATNQAAQFAAAARNSVSQFNSAEAQQRMNLSAQLWDQAQQFSAAAKQAADTFNAGEYNKAMQSYVDAKNAALAAQNDAENLSRRDTAQINAGLQQAKIGAEATVGAASQHAAATVAAAQIGAASQAASIEAQQQMHTQDMNERSREFGVQMSQQQQQWAANLSATQFNQFQSGFAAIMTTPMEPEARANAISNYFSVWSASGSLPFDITPPPST